jgi:hypothetical protein
VHAFRRKYMYISIMYNNEIPHAHTHRHTHIHRPCSVSAHSERDRNARTAHARTHSSTRARSRARTTLTPNTHNQVVVQVFGAGVLHLRVPSGTSAADLLAAATSAAKAAGSVVPPACTVFCGARRLRGGAMLAEAGVADGSRLEVRAPVAGGMPPGPAEWDKYRSTTKQGLMAMVKEARKILRRCGYAGKMTSHTLQALFQNNQNQEKGKQLIGPNGKPIRPVSGPFHPKDLWPEHYSTDAPSVVVTYTWAMDLEEELPQFMNAAEETLGLGGADARWWLDIWHIDQNKTELGTDLEKAKALYMWVKYHAVFLRHGVFKRGWCCAELCYRIQVTGRADTEGQRARSSRV